MCILHSPLQRSYLNSTSVLWDTRNLRLIWPITNSGRGATGTCAMPPSLSKPYLLQKHCSYHQETRNLRYLNLSYNQFRETGGRMLGDAIGYNDSLREIDLSWNHIRRDGAIGIAEGLMV